MRGTTLAVTPINTRCHGRGGRGMPSPLYEEARPSAVVPINVDSNQRCRGRACPSRHRVATSRRRWCRLPAIVFEAGQAWEPAPTSVRSCRMSVFSASGGSSGHLRPALSAPIAVLASERRAPHQPPYTGAFIQDAYHFSLGWFIRLQERHVPPLRIGGSVQTRGTWHFARGTRC